jgi:hypothetical protein
VYSAAEFKKLDNKEQRVLIWNCEWVPGDNGREKLDRWLPADSYRSL